jgi:poly(hydroxyalkanoate) depolymerase family esterase
MNPLSNLILFLVTPLAVMTTPAFASVPFQTVDLPGFGNLPGLPTSGCLPDLPCAGSGSSSGSGDASGLPGQWTQGSFSNDAGSRDYYLYIPKNSTTGPIPLYVMLHGCEQDAPTFAAITGMRELGEQYGFAVLFPQEASSDNDLQCWNWFDTSNFTRGAGEISIIAGMVGQAQGKINLDMTKIYVGGMSAGAALAVDLISCYNDLFSGALVGSGLMFEAATSEADTFTAMSSGSSADPTQTGTDAARCTGSAARLSPVIIVHGSADTTVNPTNSTQVMEEVTQMNNVLDNGHTQTTTTISSEQATAPGGESYTTDTYGGQGGQVHIVSVTVQGMPHAWSGAHSTGEFTDQGGPDESALMIQFMNQYATH